MAGSLMAIPPLPPGSQSLAGSFTIDLQDINLLQWASQVQEVTSHMRWPPEAAVSCPQADIVKCPGPAGGPHQGAILPTLFWSRPEVSVLCSPSPGPWPDYGFVGASHSELRGYGLLH